MKREFSDEGGFFYIKPTGDSPLVRQLRQHPSISYLVYLPRRRNVPTGYVIVDGQLRAFQIPVRGATLRVPRVDQSRHLFRIPGGQAYVGHVTESYFLPSQTIQSPVKGYVVFRSLLAVPDPPRPIRDVPPEPPRPERVGPAPEEKDASLRL